MVRYPSMTPLRHSPRRSKHSARSVPDLKRHRFLYAPKRRFILFCEGEKTEPDYFAAISRANSNALVEIKSHRGVGVPYTVAEQASQYAKTHERKRRGRSRKMSFGEYDQVWAVFDRDDHPRFNEAIDLCQRNGIRIARSNPCFELWLILHETDYNKPNSRHRVQAFLHELRPEYDRKRSKTPDCEDLVSRVKDAEERAETQLRNRELDGCPFGNPSTTVGQLTRAIREASEGSLPSAATPSNGEGAERAALGATRGEPESEPPVLRSPR